MQLKSARKRIAACIPGSVKNVEEQRRKRRAKENARQTVSESKTRKENILKDTAKILGIPELDGHYAVAVTGAAQIDSDLIREKLTVMKRSHLRVKALEELDDQGCFEPAAWGEISSWICEIIPGYQRRSYYE